MSRLNLGATADNIHFTEEIWAWLELLEDLLHVQQDAHLLADSSGYRADTAYKRVLVTGLHNARQTFHAIYLLLRFELVNQAAAQVRLLCEGLITLEYISLDPEARATRYWEYGYIEAYERVEALLASESQNAAPQHVRALIEVQDGIKPEYDRLKPTFTTQNRKGRSRPFRGWANNSVARQASECGPSTARLYALVYKTMSAYVHGTGWSLRKQGAYSLRHYDPDVVILDFAEIVRTTVVIWIDLADFCRRELGWDLIMHASTFAARVNALDASYSSRRAKPSPPHGA